VRATLRAHGAPLGVHALVVALGCLTGACKESRNDAADAAPTGLGQPPPPASTQAPLVNGIPAGDYGNAPMVPQPLHLPPAAESNSAVTASSSVTIPGTKGTPPDPFDVATGEVQASSVGCFAGQPAGEYAATLQVSVTPTGTASRVEVEGVTDAAVKSCLSTAAERKWPASKDGRKLRIEVRVKG